MPNMHAGVVLALFSLLLSVVLPVGSSAASAVSVRGLSALAQPKHPWVKCPWLPPSPTKLNGGGRLHELSGHGALFTEFASNVEHGDTFRVNFAANTQVRVSAFSKTARVGILVQTLDEQDSISGTLADSGDEQGVVFTTGAQAVAVRLSLKYLHTGSRGFECSATTLQIAAHHGISSNAVSSSACSWCKPLPASIQGSFSTKTSQPVCFDRSSDADGMAGQKPVLQVSRVTTGAKNGLVARVRARVLRDFLPSGSVDLMLLAHDPNAGANNMHSDKDLAPSIEGCTVRDDCVVGVAADMAQIVGELSTSAPYVLIFLQDRPVIGAGTTHGGCSQLSFDVAVSIQTKDAAIPVCAHPPVPTHPMHTWSSHVVPSAGGRDKMRLNIKERSVLSVSLHDSMRDCDLFMYSEEEGSRRMVASAVQAGSGWESLLGIVQAGDVDLSLRCTWASPTPPSQCEPVWLSLHTEPIDVVTQSHSCSKVEDTQQLPSIFGSGWFTLPFSWGQDKLNSRVIDFPIHFEHASSFVAAALPSPAYVPVTAALLQAEDMGKQFAVPLTVGMPISHGTTVHSSKVPAGNYVLRVSISIEKSALFHPKDIPGCFSLSIWAGTVSLASQSSLLPPALSHWALSAGLHAHTASYALSPGNGFGSFNTSGLCANEHCQVTLAVGGTQKDTNLVIKDSDGVGTWSGLQGGAVSRVLRKGEPFDLLASALSPATVVVHIAPFDPPRPKECADDGHVSHFKVKGPAKLKSKLLLQTKTGKQDEVVHRTLVTVHLEATIGGYLSVEKATLPVKVLVTKLSNKLHISVPSSSAEAESESPVIIATSKSLAAHRIFGPLVVGPGVFAVDVVLAASVELPKGQCVRDRVRLSLRANPSSSKLHPPPPICMGLPLKLASQGLASSGNLYKSWFVFRPSVGASSLLAPVDLQVSVLLEGPQLKDDSIQVTKADFRDARKSKIVGGHRHSISGILAKGRELDLAVDVGKSQSCNQHAAFLAVSQAPSKPSVQKCLDSTSLDSIGKPIILAGEEGSHSLTVHVKGGSHSKILVLGQPDGDPDQALPTMAHVSAWWQFGSGVLVKSNCSASSHISPWRSWSSFGVTDVCEVVVLSAGQGPDQCSQVTIDVQWEKLQGNWKDGHGHGSKTDDVKQSESAENAETSEAPSAGEDWNDENLKQELESDLEMQQSSEESKTKTTETDEGSDELDLGGATIEDALPVSEQGDGTGNPLVDGDVEVEESASAEAAMHMPSDNVDGVPTSDGGCGEMVESLHLPSDATLERLVSVRVPVDQGSHEVLKVSCQHECVISVRAEAPEGHSLRLSRGHENEGGEKDALISHSNAVPSSLHVHARAGAVLSVEMTVSGEAGGCTAVRIDVMADNVADLEEETRCSAALAENESQFGKRDGSESALSILGLPHRLQVGTDGTARLHREDLVFSPKVRKLLQSGEGGHIVLPFTVDLPDHSSDFGSENEEEVDNHVKEMGKRMFLVSVRVRFHATSNDMRILIKKTGGSQELLAVMQPSLRLSNGFLESETSVFLSQVEGGQTLDINVIDSAIFSMQSQSTLSQHCFPWSLDIDIVESAQEEAEINREQDSKAVNIDAGDGNYCNILSVDPQSGEIPMTGSLDVIVEIEHAGHAGTSFPNGSYSRFAALSMVPETGSGGIIPSSISNHNSPGKGVDDIIASFDVSHFAHGIPYMLVMKEGGVTCDGMPATGRAVAGPFEASMCACSGHGSCNRVGKCVCQEGYAAPDCSECESGYFNKDGACHKVGNEGSSRDGKEDAHDEGGSECACGPHGSCSDSHNPLSCSCNQGFRVGGDGRCSECATGYSGFPACTENGSPATVFEICSGVPLPNDLTGAAIVQVDRVHHLEGAFDVLASSAASTIDLGKQVRNSLLHVSIENLQGTIDLRLLDNGDEKDGTRHTHFVPKRNQRAFLSAPLKEGSHPKLQILHRPRYFSGLCMQVRLTLSVADAEAAMHKEQCPSPSAQLAGSSLLGSNDAGAKGSVPSMDFASKDVYNYESPTLGISLPSQHAISTGKVLFQWPIEVPKGSIATLNATLFFPQWLGILHFAVLQQTAASVLPTSIGCDESLGSQLTTLLYEGKHQLALVLGPRAPSPSAVCIPYATSVSLTVEKQASEHFRCGGATVPSSLPGLFPFLSSVHLPVGVPQTITMSHPSGLDVSVFVTINGAAAGDTAVHIRIISEDSKTDKAHVVSTSISALGIASAVSRSTSGNVKLEILASGQGSESPCVSAKLAINSFAAPKGTEGTKCSSADDNQIRALPTAKGSSEHGWRTSSLALHKAAAPISFVLKFPKNNKNQLSPILLASQPLQISQPSLATIEVMSPPMLPVFALIRDSATSTTSQGTLVASPTPTGFSYRTSTLLQPGLYHIDYTAHAVPSKQLSWKCARFEHSVQVQPVATSVARDSPCLQLPPLPSSLEVLGVLRSQASFAGSAEFAISLGVDGSSVQMVHIPVGSEGLEFFIRMSIPGHTTLELSLVSLDEKQGIHNHQSAAIDGGWAVLQSSIPAGKDFLKREWAIRVVITVDEKPESGGNGFDVGCVSLTWIMRASYEGRTKEHCPSTKSISPKLPASISIEKEFVQDSLHWVSHSGSPAIWALPLNMAKSSNSHTPEEGVLHISVIADPLQSPLLARILKVDGKDSMAMIHGKDAAAAGTSVPASFLSDDVSQEADVDSTEDEDSENNGDGNDNPQSQAASVEHLAHASSGVNGIALRTETVLLRGQLLLLIQPAKWADSFSMCSEITLSIRFSCSQGESSTHHHSSGYDWHRQFDLSRAFWSPSAWVAAGSFHMPGLTGIQAFIKDKGKGQAILWLAEPSTVWQGKLCTAENSCAVNQHPESGEKDDSDAAAIASADQEESTSTHVRVPEESNSPVAISTMVSKSSSSTVSYSLHKLALQGQQGDAMQTGATAMANVHALLAFVKIAPGDQPRSCSSNRMSPLSWKSADGIHILRVVDLDVSAKQRSHPSAVVAKAPLRLMQSSRVIATVAFNPGQGAFQAILSSKAGSVDCTMARGSCTLDEILPSGEIELQIISSTKALENHGCARLHIDAVARPHAGHGLNDELAVEIAEGIDPSSSVTMTDSDGQQDQGVDGNSETDDEEQVGVDVEVGPEGADTSDIDDALGLEDDSDGEGTELTCSPSATAMPSELFALNSGAHHFEQRIHAPADSLHASSVVVDQESIILLSASTPLRQGHVKCSAGVLKGQAGLAPLLSMHTPGRCLLWVRASPAAGGRQSRIAVQMQVPATHSKFKCPVMSMLVASAPVSSVAARSQCMSSSQDISQKVSDIKQDGKTFVAMSATGTVRFQRRHRLLRQTSVSSIVSVSKPATLTAQLWVDGMLASGRLMLQKVGSSPLVVPGTEGVDEGGSVFTLSNFHKTLAPGSYRLLAMLSPLDLPGHSDACVLTSLTAVLSSPEFGGLQPIRWPPVSAGPVWQAVVRLPSHCSGETSVRAKLAGIAVSIEHERLEGDSHRGLKLTAKSEDLMHKGHMKVAISCGDGDAMPLPIDLTVLVNKPMACSAHGKPDGTGWCACSKGKAGTWCEAKRGEISAPPISTSHATPVKSPSVPSAHQDPAPEHSHSSGSPKLPSRHQEKAPRCHSEMCGCRRPASDPFSCIPLGKCVLHGRKPSCRCADGYTGDTCQACVAGFTGWPHCQHSQEEDGLAQSNTHSTDGNSPDISHAPNGDVPSTGTASLSGTLVTMGVFVVAIIVIAGVFFARKQGVGSGRYAGYHRAGRTEEEMVVLNDTDDNDESHLFQMDGDDDL